MKTKEQCEKEFDEGCGVGMPDGVKAEVKSFISSLRKNDIESLREWVESKKLHLNKNDEQTFPERHIRNTTYNQCLDDLSTHLSEELKNLD